MANEKDGVDEPASTAVSPRFRPVLNFADANIAQRQTATELTNVDKNAADVINLGGLGIPPWDNVAIVNSGGLISTMTYSLIAADHTLLTYTYVSGQITNIAKTDI